MVFSAKKKGVSRPSPRPSPRPPFGVDPLPKIAATDFLSKIWQHNTTVSFVGAIHFFLRRKPANSSKCVWIGPKHNKVYFKSLGGCLLIKSWSSYHHMYAGKRYNRNPVDNRPSKNKDGGPKELCLIILIFLKAWRWKESVISRYLRVWEKTLSHRSNNELPFDYETKR